MDNLKYILGVIFVGLIVLLSMNVNSCNKKNPDQKIIDSINYKIDTLLVEKDKVVFRYKESKKIVYIRDSIYLNERTLENCDSLVNALKSSVGKCDTVINVSDTLIKTLLIRDTIRVEQIKYLKNKNIFSTVIGPGGGLTPQGIQPSFGITFGIRIK